MPVLERLADLAPVRRQPGGSSALTLADLASSGGKAHAPNTPSVLGTSPAPQRISAPGSQARHLNAYAGGNDAIDWVMACASLIADTAAAAPTHFEKDGKTLVPHLTDDFPVGTEQAPSDLAALFEQPNPATDWTELITLTIVDYLLTGNGWWWKYGAERDESGKPLALFRLHPQHVSIKVNKEGGIDGYEYNPPGRGGKAIIPPEQIVHFKRSNPHDEFYGSGIIAGAPRIYDLELYVTESMTTYYEKGTRLSGVLETDQYVTPSLFDKMKKQFRSFYGGRENAYDVAVLERGLKYNTIQNSAADAKYVEVAEFSRDRILSNFRVPGSLLGINSVGSTSGSRAEDQRVFDNKTMRPFLDKIQRVISLGVTQAWGLDFVFEYEYLPPKEDQLELAGTLAALPGIKLVEVREAAGYPPLGDEELDEMVLNLPGENDNESDVKDRNLPGEAGRPPNGENTAEITSDLPADGAARVRAKNGREKPVG